MYSPTKISAAKVLRVGLTSLESYLSQTEIKSCEHWCKIRAEIHFKEVEIDGIIYRGTIRKLCEMFNQDQSKVKVRMRRQGMSLAEALSLPTKRVNKWRVDGVVMKTVEMCNYLGISSKAFNNKRCRCDLPTLKEYFKIKNDISPVI